MVGIVWLIARNSTQLRKLASQKSTLALKPRADVTWSPKQGYQCQHLCFLRKTRLKSDIPDCGEATVDKGSCSSSITRWEDPICSSRAINHIDPETDEATCCTTGVWSSHTSLSVNTKINPLVPSSVQWPCRAQLATEDSMCYFTMCVIQAFIRSVVNGL